MKTRAWAGFIAGLVLNSTVGAAAPTESAATPSSRPLTVLLDRAETDYSLINRSAALQLRTQPFRKEPALEKGPVLRGSLALGSRRENTFSFLWLRKEARLHLDLNRNEDLTDDPEGVFRALGVAGSSQNFTNVRLPLTAASGRHAFKLDLMLYSPSASWAYAHVGIQSCWRGKAVWQGQDVELAVVESFVESGSADGPFLVLRPWERHASRIGLAEGTADAMILPKRLFWRDWACRVNRSFETNGTVARCRLDFVEEKPALGQIQVTGEMLNRIILEDASGYTAVLDGPVKEAKAPLGNYRVSEVWVKKDAAEAVQEAGRVLALTDKGPASLRAGGPLTNSVNITRRGKSLVLNYELVGIDGGPYRLQNVDRQNPPQVKILRQGKQVASGKFAYG